ncbi:MAG TPA: RNA polymerase sigma factor [Allosphingosinicella sp.]
MDRTKSRIFDEYLVASARAGDRRAFELLAGRWHRKLVAHAWRLSGSIEEARDAAQSAWIEIARGLRRLRDERAFPAWAYRITSRACARQIGGEVRRRRIAETLAAQPEEAAEEAGARIDADRLRAAIRGLPPDQRAAIGLFHFEDMSVAEIAVALDVPAGTVKTRLMHARRKLRAALEGEI